MLNVGANQAALAVNEAARHVGQAKLAAMLEERIAERTMELATANVTLKKEIAERKLSEQSLMPTGLLDKMFEIEVIELLKFLLRSQ